jgi:hypothetical protein
VVCIDASLASSNTPCIIIPLPHGVVSFPTDRRHTVVMLLFLIMYLFSIMGCLFFGVNDSARFGTVPQAMLTLFQVSTLFIRLF